MKVTGVNQYDIQYSNTKSVAASVLPESTTFLEDEGQADAETDQLQQNRKALHTYTFPQAPSFQLVGATSEIEDIDVEKAFADMKKDTVLEQYKYFIDSPNMGTDENGTVRMVHKGDKVRS
jgi:hypothetical protein